jgi:hypothetical protein
LGRFPNPREFSSGPHCPFCKAPGQLKRWQRKYPTELHTCRVCGTRFSPAETATSRRDEWNRKDLREILGDEAFRRFARDYLVARGETVEAAKGIVEETEAGHIRFLERARVKHELEIRRQRFLEEHVFANLACLPEPVSEFSDGVKGGYPIAEMHWMVRRKKIRAVCRVPDSLLKDSDTTK